MKKDYIYTLTSRYLKANGKRTLITRLSLTLMVALLTCVFVGKDSVMGYMTDAAEQTYGKWHVAFYDISVQEYEEIRNNKAVDETALSDNLGYTVFEGSHNPSVPFLNIRLYEEKAFEWNDIHLAEGRLPISSDEIVISKNALDDGAEIKIGDRISADCFERYIYNFGNTDTYFPFLNLTIKKGETVKVPQQFPYYVKGIDDAFYLEHEEIHESTGFRHEYTVVGFIESPDYETMDSAYYTAISLFDINDPANETFNGFCRTDYSAGSVESVVNLLGKERTEINNPALAFSGNSSDNTINSLVLIAQVFFTVLICGASMLLIYNAYQLSFDDRRVFLGQLASAGATGKQKRKCVYYETLSHLLYSIPLGFVLGLVITYAGITLLKPYGDALAQYGTSGIRKMETAAVSLRFKPFSILLTVIFSVVTAFASSVLPARKASRIGVIESIRGNDSTKVKKEVRAIKTDRAEKLLSKAMISRQGRSSNTIIRAMIVFLVLLTVTGYTGTEVMEMARHKLVGGSEPIFKETEGQKKLNEDEEIYSIFLFREPELAEEIIEDLDRTEGIRDISYNGTVLFSGRVTNDWASEEYRHTLREFMGVYGDDDLDGWIEAFSHASMYVIEDRTYDKILREQFNTVASGDRSCIVYDQASLSTEGVMVGDQSSDSFHYYEIEDSTVFEKGDVLHLETEMTDENGKAIVEDFNVDAVARKKDIEEYLNITGGEVCMIVSRSTLDSTVLWENSSCNIIFIADRNNPQAWKMITRLESRNNAVEGSSYNFGPKNANTSGGYAIFHGMISIVMTAFTAIVSLICLLNIFNSISSLMVKRRKETAVMRSIGMTDDQLRKTYLLELCHMLIRSILVALPVSVTLGFVIHNLLMSRFGSFTVNAPYGTMVLTVILAIGAVFAVQQICFTTELKNRNIIDEIRTDSH